jgi:hypothetical protein
LATKGLPDGSAGSGIHVALHERCSTDDVFVPGEYILVGAK